ncbi:hypothetical protein K474DRAFT_1676399 [Panus rudis PR-1116 ss-1]|nr:hypothetical protein K474DRAFT_1676399 [Panus rudis PR-1116 ss-1]
MSSSSLINNITIFIEAYFKLQNLHSIVTGSHTQPLEPEKPTAPEGSDATPDSLQMYYTLKAEYRADLAQWKRDNNKYNDDKEKAVGLITLKVSTGIASEIKGKGAANAWKYLKSTYGKPGAAAIYADFKALFNMKISGNQNPNAKMSQMYTQICLLKANKITILEKWENLTTVYLQITSSEKIKFADVCNLIIAHWEQVAPFASSHKLLAIKQKHNNLNFHQQQGYGQQQKQQQLQQQNEYKKKQRSKHGGKGKLKGNTVEHQTHHIASPATATSPSSRPPLVARISEITPHGIQTWEQSQLPAAFQYGASNKTMATLESLGIDRTLETVRRWEQSIEARQPVVSGSNVTLNDNPEPLAKQSHTSSPAGSLFSYGMNLEEEMAADAETDFGQTYVVVDHTVRLLRT